MDDTEWQVERLDLDAYLTRIGVRGPLPPTADTLRALSRAHTFAIPFENLDVVLGRGIDVDLPAIQDKLVTRGRGGYCYEHNLLMGAALDRLGFRVTRVLGRPALNAPRPIPRTHMTLLVGAGDETFLTDVGFGNDGLLEPVPLTAGVVSEQDGWVYRLAHEPSAALPWLLSLRRGDEWFPLYRFAEEAHHLVDIVVANYFISTHRRSPFVGRVFVGHVGAEERLNLNDRVLTRRRGDGTEEITTVSDQDLPDLLTARFGLPLDPAELASLST
ncbi:arylamine N-acetyltransferase family protein [Actinokineospora enzanensis]|uniref:arylamine N-acetyltransferase family protein n=1 Tax=Actinokineospora enzanensis TaxID=155975 RepID=UPI000367703D|nr:arylamine N-acetyltransferase [Actinokineospora enzanensis]